MDARPERRRRRDRRRRGFRFGAAVLAAAGKAPVADDVRFDRRYLDLIIFADQFPIRVGGKCSAALLANARHVVPKLIGIIRQPAVVRLMPGLGAARTRVLPLFFLVRRGGLGGRARIFIGPLKLEHQLDQLLLAELLQISAIHAPMDSEIVKLGKGVGSYKMGSESAPRPSLHRGDCKTSERESRRDCASRAVPAGASAPMSNFRHCRRTRLLIYTNLKRSDGDDVRRERSGEVRQ